MRKLFPRWAPSPEHSVAATLAGMVRERVPHWTEETEPGGLWIFTDPDEEYSRLVYIDGRKRYFKLTGFATATHFGPVVIGVSRGTHIEITMPECTDRTEREAILKTLTAIGALPAVASQG